MRSFHDEVDSTDVRPEVKIKYFDESGILVTDKLVEAHNKGQVISDTVIVILENALTEEIIDIDQKNNILKILWINTTEKVSKTLSA